MKSRKGRIVRGGRANRVEMEMLESRVLMTAAPAMAAAVMGTSLQPVMHAAVAGKYDLVPSFAGLPKLTGALVAGQPITGTLPVKITNAGNAASPGGLQIGAYLRPAAGGANVPLLTKPVTVGALAPKGKTTVTLNLSVPTSLKAGTYAFVVIADPNNKIGEPNNSLVVPFQITLKAGSVTLAANVVSSTVPTTITAGTATKAGTVNLAVSNLGNISTASLPAVNVAVSLRPTGGGADVPLFHQNNVKLPTLAAAVGGKASGKDTLAINVPGLTAAQTALLPAVQYKIVLTVTPATVALKLPAVTIIGPTITVAGKPSTGASIWKHGDTITFSGNTQLTGTNFLEMGSFVTNTGATGSYRFEPAGLTLTYDSGGQDVGVFTFTGSQVFLDPVLGVDKKVIFSTSPAGAVIVGTVGGKPVFAKYG